MSETQQIPDEAQEAIKQLSNQHNADPDDLEQEFVEYLEEEKEKGVSNPAKRALRRLSLAQKGGQMQSAEQLRGFVLGASDPINTSRSAINRAKEYIKNSGVERAVQQGLVKKVPSGDLPPQLASVTVTQEGEEEVYAVLDSNSNSPTSGEVLPAEDYIRYVYGAVWRSADDGPHWFSGVLNAEDNGDKPRVPPKNEPVTFSAVWVGDSDQNNTVRLRFRDTEPFETADEWGGPSVTELLEDDDLLGHDALEDTTADRYDRNDVLATYGSVTYMELAPDGDQSRRLSIVDPFAFGSDLSRTVWLPDHVDVNFAEESDIYVIAQVSPSSNDEYPDSLEALGVFVHPDYRVDRSGVESMGDDSGNSSEADGGTVVEEDESADEESDQPTPAELGAEMKDPSEVEVETEHDVEFQSGNDVDSSKGSESGEQQPSSEDSEADTDDGLPPVVEDANYPELQSVAAEVDEVPGSGISEEDMREQLVEELGPEELGRRLVGGASGGEDTDDGAEAETDDAEDGPDDEANEDTSADGGEVITEEQDDPDEDRGDFEPTDEDDDWDW